MSGSHHPARAGLAGDPDSPVHRLDPRAKLAALVGITVIAVTTPIAAWPVWPACAVVLGVVIAVARIPVAELGRRSLVVLPLVLFGAVLIPFVRPGPVVAELGPLTVSSTGLAVAAAVSAKATIGTFSALVLGATTEFPAVTRALEAMRVPRLLTLTALLTYRYAFVLAGEVRRMRWALASRGHRPAHALRAAAVGRVAGTLFLRSHARAERVHLAMLARGFDGAMPTMAPLALRRSDVLFCALVLAALLPLRVALGLAA